MELHGIPNDIMQSIDPLAIIIFVPIVDRIVYPVLRKLGREFPVFGHELVILTEAQEFP